MEGLMGFIILGVILFIVLSPPDKNSTSYRLGRGLGRKTKKLGKWIMDDD